MLAILNRSNFNVLPFHLTTEKLAKELSQRDLGFRRAEPAASTRAGQELLKD
jgi:hypothetical protein